MYAIVEIAGQQFKVEEGKKIFVHKLDIEEGTEVEFDKVLLIENGETVIIGDPVIKDALVEGKVLDQLRGEKVIVFKKKRRKGYQKSNGHRQYFTQVEIVTIHEKAEGRKPRKAVVKESAPVAEAPAAKAKKEAVVEKKVPAKKEAAKKEPIKKEATKKEPVKKEATKKEPVKKEATKKEPVKKAPAKKEAAAPAKAETKKAPAKKEAAAPAKAETKKAPVKKAAVSKSAAEKPAAKKPATRKPKSE